MRGRAKRRPPGLLDVTRVAIIGLRSARARTALSAAGIAIGISVLVAVLGITQSTQADLLAQLDRLGTNLLVITPGRGVDSETATLLVTAPAMVARIGAVQQVAAIDQLSVSVRRSNRIDPVDTGGLTVYGAPNNLLTTLHASTTHGRYLDEVLARYPTVVLGAVAAERLGVDLTDGRTQVWIGDRSFTVVGILNAVPLAPEIDSAALIGLAEAARVATLAPTPTTIYVRTAPELVPAVQSVLAATADPPHPEAVAIARPTDALTARAAAKGALNGLYIGLGAVGLLVGGLGIANVMVITVIERRTEIGLRRALGATRRNIAAQFLAEAVSLSIAGAILGTAFGIAITTTWAHSHHATTAIPSTVLAVIGFAAAIGTAAGVYPATRAALTDPSTALASS
jgi:putative ABC transport system permease protein